jgi:hypothetical protein
MNFGALPLDVQCEICHYLDVVSLARFEGTHRCVQTGSAWDYQVRARFQLSLSNSPRIDRTADPRTVFRRLLKLGGSSTLLHFKRSDKDLVRMAADNLRQLLRMVPHPSTQPAMSFVVDVFCVTTPWCEVAWNQPLGPSSDVSFDECLYEQWLVLRELAQRGIVKNRAMLQPLNAGDIVLHIGRLHTGMSGMSTLRRDGGVFQVKESRVNAVFNGIVQYQELEEDQASQFHTRRIGWAARSDMFVLQIS